MKRLIAITMAFASLFGCELNNNNLSSSDWYLRSEITWWEAKPEYKLEPNKDETLLVTSFYMEPDGQEYHIKITDKVLSREKNCGISREDQRTLRLNQWFPLNCQFQGDEVMPLAMGYQFTPESKSKIMLEVRLVNGQPYELRLRAVP